MKKARKISEPEEKKYSMPIILLGGITIICVILIILSYMSLHYAPTKIIMYAGYGIEAKIVTKNLRNENYENVAQVIPLLEVKEQETVYENKNNYYIGVEERKGIDLKYPIYINEKAALLNLSEDVHIITNNYERVQGYENFVLTEGKLYNAHDLSKADNNEYIFVETGEGTFVALKELKIKTELREITIPVNSIIYFTEKYITYYQVEEDKLIYNNILDVDKGSIITVENSTEQNYEEFLNKMGIIQVTVTGEKPEKKPEIEIDITIKDENKEETEEEKQEYIKPTITAKGFEAKVYTAETTIQLNDPQGRVTQAIFIITKNNKTYQRRQIISTGKVEITGLTPETEFEIEGKYRYYNEENQEVEETFCKQKIKTKSIKELGSIVLEHEPGEIFSKKVEIKNLKLKNDINEEVVKGIAKIQVEIDGAKYNLSNDQVNRIKNKEAIIFQTSETVKSNKNITYKIYIYDNQGNELDVENYKGKTRTSKETPTVKVQMKTQDIHLTEMKLDLKNKDNVKLENYYYVILENGQEIIREELKEKDKEISRRDLNSNGYYTICFYADFDLKDDKGIRRNNKIGEATFTTMPLSSLGNVFWTTEVAELEANRVSISIKLDEIKTDKRLIQLIDYMELKLLDKEGNLVEKYQLNKEIIKQGQVILQDINGLESNTEYNYEIVTRVKQGSTEEEAKKQQTNNNFITMKKPAEVLIENKFITGELLDFDVKIQDEDGAVLTKTVTMEIRDRDEKLIVIENIKTNGEFERKQYNKLIENETYTIKFYADQYNEGSSNETYQANYILYNKELVTEMGINGSLKIYSVGKKETGKNLINVASKVNWVSNSLFNNTSSYGKTYNEETKIMQIKGNNKYVYDLRDYAGETVTISFEARGTGNVGIQNGKTNKTEARQKIQNLNSSNFNNYSYTVQLSENPDEAYLGFYITSGNTELKNVQVELGSNQTGYEPFEYQRQLQVEVSVEDTKDEITTNDYYIRIYKNDDLAKEDRYEEIGESNKVEKAIKEFENISEGSTYRIELLVKIRDRYYILDFYELEIKKDDEIKAIRNEEEFLEIQPYGHYVIVNDLDFSEQKCTLTGSSWYGILDFNGHTFIKNISTGNNRVIPTIERGAIIENLVFDIRLDNEEALSSVYRTIL